MNEEPKTIFGVPVEFEEMIAPAERSEMASGEALIPVRRGDRAGEFRTGRGHSAAGRLRRDLLRAGVTRHQCIRGAEEKPVRVGETCCPNMASDPLFAETAVTRPVDFHSFRRAFSTALAAAGINSQQAMRLASHSDEKTHMRYVMTTPAMKAIPAAVIPRLPGRLLPQKKQVATIARRSPRNPSVILVGRPGLEPGTYGLREHSGTEEVRGVGSVCDPNGALREAARGILLAAAEGREVEWAVAEALAREWLAQTAGTWRCACWRRGSTRGRRSLNCVRALSTWRGPRLRARLKRGGSRERRGCGVDADVTGVVVGIDAGCGAASRQEDAAACLVSGWTADRLARSHEDGDRHRCRCARDVRWARASNQRR